MAEVTINSRAISNETQLILKDLQRFQDEITDVKTRRRIMRKPASIIVKAVRPTIKPSRKPHYRYSTYKVVKRRRAAKGAGVRVAKYLPGNLAASIKRLNFKRSSREYIGPKLVGRSVTGTFGPKTGKADGYYAQMIEGSAAAFRRKYMEPALRKNASRVRRVAEEEKDKLVKKLKLKTGL